jgi:hypothetical protein
VKKAKVAILKSCIEAKAKKIVLLVFEAGSDRAKLSGKEAFSG